MKIPPQDIDAEKAFLGSLILQPLALKELGLPITRQSFYAIKNSMVFDAISDLISKDDPVDFLTLSGYLKEKGELEKIGGASYLTELVNTVPSSTNIDKYAEIIQRKFFLREMAGLCEQAIGACFKEEKKPEVIAHLVQTGVEKLLTSLTRNDEDMKSKLSTYRGEDEVIDTNQVIAKIKNQKEEEVFMSGFAGLDKILKGFRPQQLVVISAGTKAGKTSMCIDLTCNFRSLHPLWFPFEESAEELIRKFLERGETPPMLYTPSSIVGNTMLWLEKKIIESVAKYGTKVVFIDHLHFIVPFSEQRQDLRIGETMRALKTLAKKWNVTIFLIAHMKKTKVDSAPTLEDLRDSSFVAQEADTVLLLWRETKRGRKEIEITNNSILSVQANRRTGSTGNIRLVYSNGHFLEQDWKDADDDFKAW